MKIIKFVGYLFYRYYSNGPRANIPYFNTTAAMTFLGYMHLMQILILLDKIDLIPIDSSDGKTKKYFIFLLVMLPIYFVMILLFKKSDIKPLKEKYEYNWDKVFKGNVWLVIYIIVSFTLIFILAIWKKH